MEWPISVICMSKIHASIAKNQLKEILAEGFNSPHGTGYFTSASDDAGLNNALKGLNASQASRKTQPGGSSIASHANHLVFAFEAFIDWIEKKDNKRDWAESWSVKDVNEFQWSDLVERLAACQQKLAEAIDNTDLDDEQSFGGAVAAIVHMAYHLGAIRQKLVALHHL